MTEKLLDDAAIIYGPRVRVIESTRDGAVEDSLGFRPIRNNRNAKLLAAERDFGAEVMARNTVLLRDVVAVMVRDNK